MKMKLLIPLLLSCTLPCLADSKDDDIHSVVGAVMGWTPSAPAQGDTMDSINMWRMWTEPVGYASAIMSGQNDRHKNCLNYLLHNYDALMDNHISSGLVRWRYAYGRNLPAGVITAMQAMRDRHNGILPTKETIRTIGSQSQTLEPEMQGFIPRCQLAVEPTVSPWLTLDDPEASLFLMPDTSAVLLPQWNPSLLGTSADLAEDCSILDRLASRISEGNSLPALQAFALAEADLALPDNYWHSWLGVEGYNTFRLNINSIYKPDGIDITITNTGPKFSSNDTALQQSARALSIALHRCILRLAWLERHEQTQQLDSGCEQLAASLNRYDLWPLLCSEYELRGISPETYVLLIRRFEGKPELLNAFAAAAGMHGITTMGNAMDRGNLTAEHLSSLIREFFILNGIIPGTAQERTEIARTWFERARQQSLPTVIRFLCLKDFANIVNEWDDIPADFVSKTYAYTGYKLVKHALAEGHTDRARQICDLMEQGSIQYNSTPTNLARAALLRMEGNTKKAGKAVANALAAAAHQTKSNNFQSYLARRSLIDDGLLIEAEKILTLLKWQDNRYLQRCLMESFAKAGQYESAAFQAGSMMHLACINSTPVNGISSQADIVELRTYADACRALSMLRQGKNTAGANTLLNAALDNMRCKPLLAAKLAPVILSSPSLPSSRRQAIKQNLISTTEQLIENTGHKAARIARDAIARVPVEDIAPAPEIAGATGDNYDRYPQFTSETYDWHLILPGSNRTELFQATIVMADYENPRSKWVYLKNREGRKGTILLDSLLPEDIDNIIDWKNRNGIRTWKETLHPSTGRPVGDPLDGKILYKSRHLTTDSPSDDIDDGASPYILIRRPMGNVQRINANILDEENRRIIRNWQPPDNHEQNILRTFPTWKRAVAYAECNNILATAYVLGKRGGPEEAEFNKQILDNPAKIASLSQTHAVVLCYRDDNGEWDDNAKEIFSILRPTIESISPPGTDNKNNPYTSGFFYTCGRHTCGRRNCSYGAPFKHHKLTEEEQTFEQAIRRADTAATYALLNRNKKLIHARLATGTDLPLVLAVRTMQPDIIRLLLENGADANSRDSYGYTMLYTACLHRNLPVAELLLRHGADPDMPTYMSHNGECPIPHHPLIACGNHPELYILLLKSGADPNAGLKCTRGSTAGPAPLTNLVSTRASEGDATLARTTECIRLLLAAGADADTSEGSHLFYAIANNRTEWVRMLLQAGADPNGAASPGNRPIHQVSSSETFQLLIEAGAEAQPDDPYLIGNAVAQGLKDSVTYLIQRGTRLDIRYNGKSLLQWAADGTAPYNTGCGQNKQRISNVIATAEYLISQGLNVNETDETGISLLAYAKQHAHPDFVAMLLRHGAQDKPESPAHTPPSGP